MTIPNTTYRVLVEKLGDSDPSQFIGNEGEIFYDPDSGSPVLKLSDGSTPGGVSIGGTGTGGGSYSPTAGIATYASTAGIATVATYAETTGVSTTLSSTSSVNTTGIITAAAFVGDGSGLTNLPSGGGGGTSDFVRTGAGIHTLGNVGVGTTNPEFLLHIGSVGSSGTAVYINGDVRIVGILTVGNSSITFDGSNNTINVGSGVTISGDTGDITAQSLTVGSGTITDISQISTGNITFSEQKIIGLVTTGFDTGLIQLVPSLDDAEQTGNLYFTNGQYVNIYPTVNDDAPHIHITAGTLSTESQYYSNIPFGAIDNFSYSPPSTLIGEANNTYLSVAATNGSGFGATFDVSRDENGELSSVDNVNMGQDYQTGDILTIDGSLIGGVTGDDDLEIEVVVVYDASSVSVLGDLFLGDDDNYVLVQGDGYISLTSGNYGGYIDIDSSLGLYGPQIVNISSDNDIVLSTSEIRLETVSSQITLDENGSVSITSDQDFTLTSSGSIEENCISSFTVSSEDKLKLFVFNTVIGITTEYNADYPAKSEFDTGIILRNESSFGIEDFTPFNSNHNGLAIYEDGTYFGDDRCLGKTSTSTVSSGTTSLIYTTKHFVGAGTSIGSVKLIIQCQGDNGGTQLSELLVIKEYNGENVYQAETVRAGIGTVDFTSTYNSEEGYIEVSAFSEDVDEWSIRIIPLEIKEYQFEEMPA